MAYAYQTEIITLEKISPENIEYIRQCIQDILKRIPGEYNNNVLHSVKINPEPEDD